LVGRGERRGADRFQRRTVSRDWMPGRVGQGMDFLQQPVEKGGAYRRAVQAAGQPLRDGDGEPARTFGPRLFGGLPVRLDRRFRGRAQRIGFGPCVVEAFRPRLFGLLLGGFQDRLVFLFDAGTRVFHLGERRRRLSALVIRFGEHLAGGGAALLDDRGDGPPEETLQQPYQDDDIDG